MVAGVVGGTGGAAVDRRLLGRLDVFRAAEEAAGRDARVYERFVVGASIELGMFGLEPLGGEVVEEYVLYRPQAARPGGPEGVLTLRLKVTFAVMRRTSASGSWVVNLTK